MLQVSKHKNRISSLSSTYVFQFLLCVSIFESMIDTFPFPMRFDLIEKVVHAGKDWVSLSFKLSIFNNFLEVKI